MAPRAFYRPKTRDGRQVPPIRERIAALRSIPRFVKLIWSTKPSYAVGIVTVRVLVGLTPIAMLWVGKLIIDAVVASVQSPPPNWGLLIQLVVLELAIALLSDVLQRIGSLLETLLGELFTNELSVRLMRHAGVLDLERLEDPSFFDKLLRARVHASRRVTLFSAILMIGEQSITVVSLLAAIIAYEPWLVLILVLATLPAVVGEAKHAGITYSFMFQWTRERRELAYYRWLATDLRPAKEIKLFGLSDYLADRYSALADDYVAEHRRVATNRTATGTLLASVSTLAYYGAVATIVYEAAIGIITIGTLAFLTGAFQRSRRLITGILMGVARGYEQGLFVKDLFEFFEVRSAIASPANAMIVANPIRRGLVFENVGFRYVGSERWAIRDVSLEISPGECVALVGENGAGKTTLVKLMTRLYDPTEGRILLDGRDLRLYELESLREAFGVILQDFFRYDLKVRENIAVGCIAADNDMARVVDAAEKSLAARVISRLEKGYEQLLGRRFEWGTELSGGEWQKIALARAYMRDAQVLILDEPTAALDARAEYEVFQRFSDLVSSKTGVLISHRFSTVRMADRIIVLSNGSVSEEGSHEVLLDAEGKYAELFAIQAAGYR